MIEKRDLFFQLQQEIKPTENQEKSNIIKI
jgi:hypothetical protein